jgi:PAS domain S-box-containing protein
LYAGVQAVEEHLTAILENTAEAFIELDSAWCVTRVNRKAEQLLGINRDNLLGKLLWDVFPEGTKTQFDQKNHQAIGKQVAVEFEAFYPTLNRWLMVRLCPSQTGVFAYFLDITGQKELETALQKEQDFLNVLLDAEEKRVELVREQVARAAAEAAQQQSAFLAEVSAILASSLDYEQTLQSVANLAVPYFADWCSVDLLSDDRTINRVAVAHCDPEKVKLGWKIAQQYPRRLEDGYGVSQVILTGQSAIATEITNEQLTATVQDAQYLQILRGLNLKSCIIAPLKARGRVLGSISFVFSESNRRYSTMDLTLAEDLARRAGIAIDNARLYQEAQQVRQAAEIAADRTARLQTVTAALSESLTPLQVADVIVEQGMAVLEATSGLVALVTEDGKELEIVKAVGYHTDLVESWQRFSINADAPLAEAVRTGEPIWLETVASRVARYPHLADIYSRYDFQSWMSLPLVSEGRRVGGIGLNFKHFKQLSTDDREFILTISRLCGQAISRTQLYEAEHKARADAERANRVKDEFLAVLSHELRSPLNPILGWTKLLRNNKLEPTQANRALETIERNGKLLAQLIEDLLDISRMLRGKLSLNTASVDLVAVIQEAIETVQLAAAAKSIHIQTVLQPTEKTVLGDANRLQQVVWNLLSNAIKFTPEGGWVEVKLEAIANQMQIQVTDNGKGIQPDFLPHVFEYFRQADSSTTRRFGGLGLGLAIVHQIVELHGGTVRAESAGEGLGARFTVLLPVTSHHSELFPDTQVSTLSSDLTDVRVLVVDDQVDMGCLAEFILAQYGAKVTVASSAAEALTILTQFIPDVLLCDIGMPEMDGYMLMRHIRKLPAVKGGTIPAIALTAYASEYERRQAQAAGFQLHLPKPVDPEDLVEAIFRITNARAVADVETIGS